ncbi:tRNA-Thr(GGU) m(6)t(6)A37 methyltransferase TsaA [Catenulispora sp. GP43]|uniref:tRNA (N6-threonylcarbamoyladenosine(37)-N6)-methyltransferase TrmO n=1 Tax=Catenulispora sp. GP43 TaxID=3156263 RepID=UPI0035152315
MSREADAEPARGSDTGPDTGPDTEIAMTPIGYVQTRYLRVQDAPPQATMAYGERGRIVVFDDFVAGLDGLRAGQYVWLLTWLHDQTDEEAAPLRCVPRGWSDSGRTTGVYATRTPNRHNRIGMSLVRLGGIGEGALLFEGVDLVHGTPVLDIKPYSTESDTPPELRD